MSVDSAIPDMSLTSLAAEIQTLRDQLAQEKSRSSELEKKCNKLQEQH